MQGLNRYAIKTVYILCRIGNILGAGWPEQLLFRTLFNAYYSVPLGSVYYPSAEMIAWAARISGLIRNRWFLVSGDISIGMESVSKERLT